MSDVQSALDRSIAALDGRNVPTPIDHDGDLPPLRWNGVSWQRTPVPPGADTTPLGHTLAPQAIGPGWRVHSLSRHTEEGAAGVGRDGVCVDVTADDGGESVYVCVEHYRREVGRLDVPASDVASATPPRRGHISDLRRVVFRAMGDRPMGLVVRCEATWLAGAAVRLGELVA